MGHSKKMRKCPVSKNKEYAEKPTEFLALTGYTHQEFEALLPHFGQTYYDWIDMLRNKTVQG